MEMHPPLPQSTSIDVGILEDPRPIREKRLGLGAWERFQMDAKFEEESETILPVLISIGEEEPEPYDRDRLRMDPSENFMRTHILRSRSARP